MTEMEKALYADLRWAQAKLEALRAEATSGNRRALLEAAAELHATLAKYLGTD